MDQQQANISPTIDGILAHNRAFVERRDPDWADYPYYY